MFENYMKYCSDETEKKLDDLFELGAYGISQDWQFYATERDPQRLQKIIDSYKTMDFSDEERHAVMAVLLNSMDRLCTNHQSPPPETWNQVVQLLSKDIPHYQDLIEHWASLDVDPDDRFYLSPHVVHAFPEVLSHPRKRRDQVEE